MPSTVHPAITWSEKDPFIEWNHADIEWAIIKAKETKQKDEQANSRLKRKAPSSRLPESLPQKMVRTSTHNRPASALSQSAVSGQHLGTIWQNNSCAYDAVITILFNVWHQDPENYTAMWQQMGSRELNLLAAGFEQLTASPGLSMETVRYGMRRHFATLSDSHFRLGQYTSVHNLLLTLLSTQFSVTRTTRRCINPVHAALNESVTANAVIKVSTPCRQL